MHFISTPLGPWPRDIGSDTKVKHDDREIFLFLHDPNRPSILFPDQLFSHDDKTDTNERDRWFGRLCIIKLSEVKLSLFVGNILIMNVGQS